MKPPRPRSVRIVAAAVLALIVAPSVSAQMDMLPQIFRDLPPELQDGLPAEMTHQEYRQMERNVDFFTMFMSSFVPGYAMFHVERPALGWTIAGTRVVGTGMMVGAMARQWGDFRDLTRLDEVPDPDYQRFLGNAFLFAGGIFVNMAAWAADMIGAYHIAKSEEDFVIYKYGLRQGIAAQNGEEEQREIEYIRRLVLQDDPRERRVREELKSALSRYGQSYPLGEYRAEVEYYRGSVLREEGEAARALFHLMRQIVFFPDARFSPASRQLAIDIVQSNRTAWPEDRELLLSIIDPEVEPFAYLADVPAPAGEPGRWDSEARAARVRAYIDSFGRLRSPELRELFVAEALDIARRYPEATFAADALFAAAEQLAEQDETERAVVVYSMTAGAYPEADQWQEAMLRIGRLLHEELEEVEYAGSFYRRLLDRRPGTPQAETAREALAQLDELEQ